MGKSTFDVIADFVEREKQVAFMCGCQNYAFINIYSDFLKTEIKKNGKDKKQAEFLLNELNGILERRLN